MRCWRLLPLLVLALPASAGTSWITHTDAAGGFAVALPGEPERESTSHLTLAGRVRSEVVIAFAGSAEFRVEVHDLPVLARWFVSDTGLLERAAAGLLEDEEALRSSATDGREAGHPARTVTYEDAEGRPGEARIVFAAGRLYVRVAQWPPGDRELAGRVRFFDSFVLR